jgi:hypothetical protein
MGNQNPLSPSGDFEKQGIFDASVTSPLGVQDVNCGFTRLKTFDNIDVEIFVRQEAYRHERFMPI